MTIDKNDIAERLHSMVQTAPSSVEQRSAQDMDSWLFGGRSASGETVTYDIALKIATVWACVRNISEDTAKIPLVTYRRMKRGKERATEHPVYPLLHDAPNEDQTAMDWRSTMVQYALMQGNGYAEIVRLNGGPVAYLTEPLHPSRVKPKRDDSGTLYYEVKNKSGQTSRLSQDRIFHLKGMGDGIEGYSVLTYAKDCFGASRAAEKFSSGLFKNGLNAEGVLTHPDALSAPAIVNLRKSLAERHSGADNAGGTLILEEGMKYEKTSITPEDAQFLESKQFSVIDICRWFRMPPHKVAELSRATFSNIEQQSIDYVNDTLSPWFVRIEQEIYRKLLSPAERKVYFSEHLINGLLRGDAAARSAYYREQWNIGALSVNDIREMENQNPVDGGDTHFVPLNMVPLDRALNPAEVEPEPTEIVDPKTEPDVEDDVMRCAPHIEMLTAAFQRSLNIETDRLRAAEKKSNFAEWRDGFYRQHVSHVGNSIRLACEAIFAVFQPIQATNDAIPDQIREISQGHCDRSIEEHDNSDAMHAWDDGSRARDEAVSAVKTIILKVKHNGN